MADAERSHHPPDNVSYSVHGLLPLFQKWTLYVLKVDKLEVVVFDRLDVHEFIFMPEPDLR